MDYSFAPIADEKSKLLILGSLPGIKSLNESQYYAHPQNSFWKIILAAINEPFTSDYETKRIILLAHNIALWDVIKSAERKGSLDTNIKDEIPNDIQGFLKEHPNINFMAFNGACAFNKYKKHLGTPPLPYKKLLSTSPACAGRDEERRKMWNDMLTLTL